MKKEQKLISPTNSQPVKKPNIFQYLNPKNLKLEMIRYGEEVSTSYYIKFLLACYFGLIAFAFVFKLQIPYILFIVVIATLFLPSTFLIQFRTMYEQKRFENVNAYLEQLMYSFRRQPKILTALQDTALLFAGDDNKELRVKIEAAIQYIQNGVSEGDLYREAFEIIEEDFGCKRMYKIHNFLRQVENAGGECNESIEILLLDRNLWVNRIASLIQDKKKVRINVSISIGLSFLITLMSLYMLPDDFQIVEKAPSQLVTTFVFLANGAIWYIVQRILSKSLLTADGNVPFNELKRAYNIVMHGNLKEKQKKINVIAGLFLIGAIAMYFFFGTQIAVALGIFSILIFTQPKRQLKNAKKRIAKEVEKAFPDWLMALSLQLQTDNVHVAIMKTIPDAAEILQEELLRLQDNLETYPNSLEPYLQFFETLRIAEVTSAMKMLYAMAELGTADSQEQIKGLVNRNVNIMDKAEKMRMEDELAGISFAMLAPMLTGVLKMIV